MGAFGIRSLCGLHGPRGRRYREAVGAADALIAFDPDTTFAYEMRGFAFYALGDFQRALASCAVNSDLTDNQTCLAIVYNKLGRRADAEAVLAKYQESLRELGAYDYAVIYAQWGNVPKALEWLETALRLHDPGLLHVRTEPLLDPLRDEPRFRAVEKALKFPP
jgi:tetratricopeptide (TPR) repeat protein